MQKQCELTGGFVPLRVLSKFRRIQLLTNSAANSVELIASAVETSPAVVLIDVPPHGLCLGPSVAQSQVSASCRPVATPSAHPARLPPVRPPVQSKSFRTFSGLSGDPSWQDGLGCPTHCRPGAGAHTRLGGAVFAVCAETAASGCQPAGSADAVAYAGATRGSRNHQARGRQSTAVSAVRRTQHSLLHSVRRGSEQAAKLPPRSCR